MAYLFSLILFVVSIVSLCVNHLNLGLDFTGGVQVELHYNNSIDLNAVRDQLTQQGLPEATVIRYGSSRDAQVTLPLKDFHAEKEEQAEQLQQQVNAQMKRILPEATITRIDYVGPQVGKQLAQQGLLAVVVSLIATMIYIALRFEIRFAVSSAIALVHDPILILGVFSFFHIDFDLIALAAVLTVIGYSLNDTVVIFDRVRENFRKLKKTVPNDVMNLSINQTLSRTIMTSSLTLTVVVVLNAISYDYDLRFNLNRGCRVVFLWWCDVKSIFLSLDHRYRDWYVFFNLYRRCLSDCDGLGEKTSHGTTEGACGVAPLIFQCLVT